MAAIYDVANGVTVWDEEDVNQYGATFNNVLGITDTSQDALGRLVLPRAAAAPSSPSEGQVYYDTGDDQIYMFNGAGLWIPQGSIRQVIAARNSGGDVSLGTSPTTIVSQSITTTGGSVLAIGLALLGDGGVASTPLPCRHSATVGRSGSDLTWDESFNVGAEFSLSVYEFTMTIFNVDHPAAGTYTYYLRGARALNWQALNGKVGSQLVLIEFGPD